MPALFIFIGAVFMRMQEKEASNALYRHWQILSRLSMGKWINIRELKDELALEGVEVSLRTIQRDLLQISYRFPIESNKATPQGWRWKRDVPIQSLPYMSRNQALTFLMIEQHLKHLLPQHCMNEIVPWLDLAERNLQHENYLANWQEKVRLFPSLYYAQSPSSSAWVHDALQEAVLQSKQLCCTHQQYPDYRLTLNPIAMVQISQIFYLICSQHHSDKIQFVAFHQLKHIEILPHKAQIPNDFNLDVYLAQHVLTTPFHAQSHTNATPLASTTPSVHCNSAPIPQHLS